MATTRPQGRSRSLPRLAPASGSSLSLAAWPRALHPAAWWVWALALATAASRTSNPLLLALVLSVASYVVMARRSDAPWARWYRGYLAMAAAVVAVRVVLHLLVGVRGGGHVLLALPSVRLPDWAAGISLGGRVTAEGLLGAGVDGLRLGTIIVCVGAANSLADPKRLLRTLPGALYEVGAAVVVALTVAPQLVQSLLRVRRARRLRGRPPAGLRGLRSLTLPVLEDALDRAIALAAAMDGRGYGRTAGVPRAARRLTGALVLTGLVGACFGTYGLLDPAAGAGVGLPVLVIGLLLATAGLVLGGRRTVHTRYRPDPWRLPEWAVTATGALAVTLMLIGEQLSPESLGTQSFLGPIALHWPTLPLLPTLGVMLALLPAWLAPEPVVEQS